MNRWVVFLIAAFVLGGACVSRLAVADVVATWPFTGNTYAPTITGTPIAGLTVGDLSITTPNAAVSTLKITIPSSNYSGASGTTLLETAWTKGGFSATARGSFGFTVINSSSGAVQLSGLAFGVRMNSAGPTAYGVRYSINDTNPFTDEIASGSIATSESWFYKSHNDLSLLLPAGSTTEIRVYGYGGLANSTTYAIRFDDVRAVFTAVASVPEASAWAMGTAVVVAAWGAARFGHTKR
ncbi:MAG: hypothetical protein KF847_05855 [Pirellulales bacterium]|nr:hypothetical protein [Pirellulales bacterium]